jgi:hypothetical protein
MERRKSEHQVKDIRIIESEAWDFITPHNVISKSE